MANYIRNRLMFFHDDDAELGKALKAIANENERYPGDLTGIGTIDFERIDPCPEALKVDCGGLQSDAVQVVQTLSNWAKNVYSKAGTSSEDMTYVNVLAEKNHKTVPEMCEIGMKYIMNVAAYGYATWFEWNSANWGTSRNAENVLNDDTDTVLFDTKWTPPHKLVQKLSKKFRNLRIQHEWATEDICGDYCGTYVYKNGKLIIKEDYEGKEAIRFGCMMWGIDESEYAEELAE